MPILFGRVELSFSRVYHKEGCNRGHGLSDTINLGNPRAQILAVWMQTDLQPAKPLFETWSKNGWTKKGWKWSKNQFGIELVSKELNHFGVIAGLFRQIWGHSSRFVLFCSFWRLFTIKMIKRVKVFPFSFWKIITKNQEIIWTTKLKWLVKKEQDAGGRSTRSPGSCQTAALDVIDVNHWLVKSSNRREVKTTKKIFIQDYNQSMIANILMCVSSSV